jgi:hypothetical protein
MSTTIAARWRSLPSASRRRIVLGALVVVSLAARDLLLLVASASLFALGELAPATLPARRRDAIS